MFMISQNQFGKLSLTREVRNIEKCHFNENITPYTAVDTATYDRKTEAWVYNDFKFNGVELTSHLQPVVPEVVLGLMAQIEGANLLLVRNTKIYLSTLGL